MNPRLDGREETTLVYNNIFPQQKGSWQKGERDTSINEEPALDSASHAVNLNRNSQEILQSKKIEDNANVYTPRKNKINKQIMKPRKLFKGRRKE